MPEMTWVNALVFVALAAGAVEVVAIVVRVAGMAWSWCRKRETTRPEAEDRADER